MRRPVVLATLLVFSFIAPSKTLAQDMEIDPTRVYEGSNNILFELKPKITNPYSQFHYIKDEYNPGTILLFDSAKIENVPMRYDIMRNRMEILLKDETKVLYARKIINFDWFDSDLSRKAKFVNCREYAMTDLDIKGFFEVLVEGDFTLLSHTALKIFTNTSSVSVSGSHRSSNIFKKENFYLQIDNKVTPLPKKRKKILALIPDQKEAIIKYSRKRGLLFNRKKDLIEIFEYYNTLNKETS
ncbi:MAG: hypothetical protein ACR2MX_06320 [Cyclobacteriaceae bacterium]